MNEIKRNWLKNTIRELTSGSLRYWTAEINELDGEE